MRQLLVCTLLGISLISLNIGCDKNKSDDMSGDAKMMSTDACEHCPGVQAATADGACQKCGMKPQ